MYVSDARCVHEIHDYSIYRWRWQCDVLVSVRYSYWTTKHVRQFFKLVIRKAIQGLFYLSFSIITLIPLHIKVEISTQDRIKMIINVFFFIFVAHRFYLQLKPGGLIKVHTSVLQPTSQYKSLLISEETSSDELLALLLSSYNSSEPVEQFSIYEVRFAVFVT